MQRWGEFVAGLLFGMLIYHFVSPLLFPAVITAVFSPDDGQQAVAFINGAKSSLDVEMYEFTSSTAEFALEQAKDRGVQVRVILEQRLSGNANNKVYNELLAKGIDVRWASVSYTLTHSKFMIVDGKGVIVGSHNLSNAALKTNREASVIIYDSPTVSRFEDVFETDWSIAS